MNMSKQFTGSDNVALKAFLRQHRRRVMIAQFILIGVSIFGLMLAVWLMVNGY